MFILKIAAEQCDIKILKTKWASEIRPYVIIALQSIKFKLPICIDRKTTYSELQMIPNKNTVYKIENPQKAISPKQVKLIGS